jgi:ribosomal protein S18 acetylase RimI-like enzyme
MTEDGTTIRKAIEEDFSAMMNLLRECARDMQAGGIDQWDQKFPPEETVRKDIANQKAYVYLQNGQICGMFVMDENQPPEYTSVKWQLLQQRIAVIHRLAVRPTCHRLGIASKLMDFAEQEAAASGYGIIRLDTYSPNSRAVSLYVKRGYSKAGEVYFRGKPVPFFCFEKRAAH